MTNSSRFHVDFLKNVFARGGTISSARFSLQRDVLKRIDPVYVLTLEQNSLTSLQELPWSPELETYLLLEHPTRTASHDEESERFAAVLLNNLETAETRFGRDYTRSVFVELLRERPDYELASLLGVASTHSPSKSSRSYPDCRSFLQHSLDGLHNTARVNLGYDQQIAHSLMSSALAIVLDEIFHISARKILFPGSSQGRSELGPHQRDELRQKLVGLSSQLFTSARDAPWWRRSLETEIPEIVEAVDAWVLARPDSADLRTNARTLKSRLDRARHSSDRGSPIDVEQTQAVAQALNDVAGSLMRVPL